MGLNPGLRNISVMLSQLCHCGFCATCASNNHKFQAYLLPIRVIWMTKLFVNRASKYYIYWLRLVPLQTSPKTGIPFLPLTIHSFCERSLCFIGTCAFEFARERACPLQLILDSVQAWFELVSILIIQMYMWLNSKVKRAYHTNRRKCVRFHLETA